jgi:ornithine cyclodeaminase/alanine dehydrogenase-like protein (mu-crystallin family)
LISITVWGRDQLKAEQCAEDIKQITKLDCKVELDIEKLVRENEVLITTTPSKEYLIKAKLDTSRSAYYSYGIR